MISESNHRYLAILFVFLIVNSSLLLQHSIEVSGQAPPYPPLAPSSFKVVGVSWATPNATFNAAPGDTNVPLYVTVQNIGNRTATGLSLNLFLQQPFTNMSGGGSAFAFYGNSISPGLTASTKFLLNIARNASVGLHTLKMKIGYLQVVSGTGTTLYLKQETEVDLPLLITGTPYMAIYSVNVSPKEIIPGGNVTISGTVVDMTSSSMSNTNISVSSPAFMRGSFIYVGQSDANIPRPFSVAAQLRRDVTEGTVPIEISVSYLDSFNVNHVSSSTTSVRVIQRSFTPSVASISKGPIDIAIDMLWGIFRLLFGSSQHIFISS